jgi:MFS family permease
LASLRRSADLTGEATVGPGTGAPSERRVLIAVNAVTTAGVLPVFLFGGLAVQLRSDLDLSESAQGVVTFGYFAVSAICSATSGRLTERFGSHRSMQAAAVLGGTSSAGVALAHTYAILLVALAIGGLANALAQPAANALVVRAVAPNRQGFALGIKHAAIPTATLLAGLAVPSIGLTVGWRWAFVGAAVMAFVAVVAVPPVPERVSGSTQVARSSVRLRMRPLIVLGIGVGLGSAMANSLGAFVTSSAVHAGISAGAAGVLLAVGSVLGLVLRIGSGWLADRRGDEHLTTVAVMLAGGAVGLSGLSTGVPTVMVLGTLIAFGSGWSWPGVFNLAVVNHHPHAPAASTGLTQTGSYTGGAIGPLLMGSIVQHRGYTTAWLTFAGVALASAAVMLVARAMLTATGDDHPLLDEVTI